MDSIDYRYYPNAAPPSYSYMGYGDDSLLPPGGDANTHVPFPQETTNPLQGTFDYQSIDAYLAHPNSIPPLPAATNSPQQHQPAGISDGMLDGSGGLDADFERRRRRSSSEEKDGMTPAQSRRKAQNRAAQRAFRERKERHVRDLEAKLTLLTTTTSSLQSDNERLKLMLQRAQTENELLRASASSSPPSQRSTAFGDDSSSTSSMRHSKPVPAMLEPRVDPARLANGLLSTEASTLSNLNSTPRSGQGNLLSAGATWDLLQSHPLFLTGAIDVGEVCDRLKKLARCDGWGPMFEEGSVRRVIEEVGRNGGDQLL